jgi:hypothetical protein
MFGRVELSVFLNSSDTSSASLKSGSNNASTAASEWKLGSLARDSDSEHSDDDDEFFDCLGLPFLRSVRVIAFAEVFTSVFLF